MDGETAENGFYDEDLNRFNLQLSNEYQEVIPFGSLHIENDNKKKIIDTCLIDYGFFGIKFHPYVQGFSPGDERLYPAYERIEALQRPVSIHTGYDDYYLPEKAITLSEIETLVRKFPSLVFILSHFFYPHFDQAQYLFESFQSRDYCFRGKLSPPNLPDGSCDRVDEIDIFYPSLVAPPELPSHMI